MRSFWIVQMGPKCNRKCLIRGTQRRTDTQMWRQLDHGSRDWSDVATILGWSTAARTRRDKEWSLQRKPALPTP